MSEEKKQNGKEVLKNAATSFSSAAIGGVTVGLLTPSQAFPKSSEIEELPTVEIEESEEEQAQAQEQETPVEPQAEAENQEPEVAQVTPEPVATVEPHSMSIDMDGDGTVDLIAVDENGDGIGDAMFERIDAVEEEPAAPVEPAPADPQYMDVASSVDDSMSFNEAFAAARHEVGAGGLFVWHGNTYGTYYKEEWDAMSDADKEQYWADVNHTTSHLNNLASNAEPESIDDPMEDPMASLGDPIDDEPSDEEWDEDQPDHDDLDLMASNDLDPDIPIDNNMDMSSFA